MSAGPTLRGDGSVESEAEVELVAARDAADAAEAADKAARRAAAEAAKSAREAAKQAARAETAAKSLGGRRRWRSRVRRLLPGHPIAVESDEPQITFSDLVRAHWAWEQDLYARDSGKGDKEIERAFHRRWRQFEGRYGRIVDAYWSVRDASAVALTVARKPTRFQPDGEPIPRFHRATDWATRDEPMIAEALDDCETLAVKSEEILRGASELIALRRLYAVASHLLGFGDREWGRPPLAGEERPVQDEAHEREGKAFVSRQRTELRRIEQYYRRAGVQAGRIVYFTGMLIGTAIAGLIAVVAAVPLAFFGVWGSEYETEVGFLYLCFGAGTIGALVSVMYRLRPGGKFNLDVEVGRPLIRRLGAIRPFVGAISGMLIYALLVSGLLPLETSSSRQDLYFAVAAFFAGFSEQWLHVVMHNAEEQFGGAEGEPPPSSAPRPPLSEETPV